MLFKYIGQNPNGLADYYGYRFIPGEAVEVDNETIAAKCGRNPAFEAVSVVREVDSEPVEAPVIKKRGRPRKVNGDESGT